MTKRSLALAALALLTPGCGGAAATPTPAKTHHPTLKRVGSLPQAISKAAAVSLPDGGMMILGGLVGNTSIDTILAGAPNKLQVVAHLPQPTHDAAAAVLDNGVYLFGGGSATSTANVVRVALSKTVNRTAVNAGTLIEPLSDLGAVTIGYKAYLVGGYTGTQFATAVLRYGPATDTVVARLPQGTRYAGVAAIGRTIYVAGGLTPAGPTRNIYAVIPGRRPRVVARFPSPQAHGGLTALGGKLYYVVGRKVMRIDPETSRVSIVARLPVSLADPTVTTLGSEIVIAGGGTRGIWAFTP